MKRTTDEIIEDIVDGAIDVGGVVVGLLGILLIACVSQRYLILAIFVMIVLLRA